MKQLKFFALAVVVFNAAFHCHPGFAQQLNRSSAEVAEARLLLDTYYGQATHLEKARALLVSAMARDRGDAAAYVEAARLAVMGGDVVGTEFKDDKTEVYQALLDKALAIDPANQKAHILKAEACNLQKNQPCEKSELDHARKYGETDPWLWVGYGRYYWSIDDKDTAHQFYLKVETAGPGTSASQRKAFVSALGSLAWMTNAESEPSRFKNLAATVLRERHPSDAYAVNRMAELFLYYGMFDDAIAYAREALRTRSLRSAHLTLSASLYGKAAQLLVDHNNAHTPESLIAEAKMSNFHREDILARLKRSANSIRRLMPTLEKIVL